MPGKMSQEQHQLHREETENAENARTAQAGQDDHAGSNASTGTAGPIDDHVADAKELVKQELRQANREMFGNMFNHLQRNLKIMLKEEPNDEDTIKAAATAAFKATEELHQCVDDFYSGVTSTIEQRGQKRPAVEDKFDDKLMDCKRKKIETTGQRAERLSLHFRLMINHIIARETGDLTSEEFVDRLKALDFD